MREMASFAGTSMAKKWKRNILTFDQKFEICKLVDAETSYTSISERYDIEHSNVDGIKKERLELEGKVVNISRKKVKTMKLGEYHKLDEALYVWFRATERESNAN